MLSKGSKFKSIFSGSCPRCQEESMYKSSNPFNYFSVLKMHDHCSNCGLHYNMEPSFFYGAMYVSYGIGVALSIITFVVSNVIFGYGFLTTFFAIIGVLILFASNILRFSRNIWINMFINYDEKFKK